MRRSRLLLWVALSGAGLLALGLAMSEQRDLQGEDWTARDARLAAEATCSIQQTGAATMAAPVLSMPPKWDGSLGRVRAVAESAPFGEALAAVSEHRAKNSFEALEVFAIHAADPRVRIRALRTLAALFVERARSVILARVQDPEESSKVRTEAARLVGHTGIGAATALDHLIGSSFPMAVRRGAVLGLAGVGTASSASRALELAADPSHPLRLAASATLGHMVAPEAARRLVRALDHEGDDLLDRLTPSSRASMCGALGRSRVPEATEPLERLLRDDPSSAVRAAAANALGVLGVKDSMGALAAAARDPAPEVVRLARIASLRLAHIWD